MLARHLKIARHAPFYADRLGHLDPAWVELQSLPFTTKQDLVKGSDQFMARPLSEMVDIVQTSGTSGRAVTLMYTEEDLARIAYNEKQALATAGLTSTDRVLLTCTLDRCFIAGLAYFLGLRALGAGVIRSGAAPLETQVRLLEELKPTCLLGVPSFLRKLGRHLLKNGTDPARFKVAKLICIGEPLRLGDMSMTPLGQELETLWGAKAHSTYASTESITAFCECEAQAGGHLIPELVIAEIVDDSGQPVQPGKVGELTVTPLFVTGMPLIRYRTGDLTFINESPCTCGRTSPRIGPIIGRKYQMIKFQGTTLYPPMIQAVLDGLTVLVDYQIRVSGQDLCDRLEVLLAMEDDHHLASVDQALRAALRVRLPLKLVPAKELMAHIFPSGARKPLRFVDLRQRLT